jgi:hypothetical protein
VTEKNESILDPLITSKKLLDVERCGKMQRFTLQIKRELFPELVAN